VGLRVLAAHGQAATMAQAAVAADLHQALDVLRALAAQVALDRHLVVDAVTQLGNLVLGQVTHVRVGADAELVEDVVRRRPADAVDVREADLDALVERDVDPGDTSHQLFTPASACGAGSGR